MLKLTDSTRQVFRTVLCPEKLTIWTSDEFELCNVLSKTFLTPSRIFNQNIVESLKEKGLVEEIFKWISCNAPHYQCKECGYEQHLDDDFYTFEAETLAKYVKS